MRKKNPLATLAAKAQGVPFVTAINCIDGRTHAALIHHLRAKWNASHVDMITEPGIAETMALGRDMRTIKSVFQRVDVSRRAHDSKHLAIAAHHDCAASPKGKEAQVLWLQKAVTRLAKRYPYTDIVGVWIDEDFVAHDVVSNKPDRGPHKRFGKERPSAPHDQFGGSYEAGTRSMAESRRAAPQGPTVRNRPIEDEGGGGLEPVRRLFRVLAPAAFLYFTYRGLVDADGSWLAFLPVIAIVAIAIWRRLRNNEESLDEV